MEDFDNRGKKGKRRRIGERSLSYVKSYATCGWSLLSYIYDHIYNKAQNIQHLRVYILLEREVHKNVNLWLYNVFLEKKVHCFLGINETDYSEFVLIVLPRKARVQLVWKCPETSATDIELRTCSESPHSFKFHVVVIGIFILISHCRSHNICRRGGHKSSFNQKTRGAGSGERGCATWIRSEHKTTWDGERMGP